MADIAKRFKKRTELEHVLLDMFPNRKPDGGMYLFHNDFTEEGYGSNPQTPLALFYVRTPDGDQHVGTWNKKTRKGWIFQRAYDLLEDPA